MADCVRISNYMNVVIAGTVFHFALFQCPKRLALDEALESTLAEIQRHCPAKAAIEATFRSPAATVST